jgi:ferredoxin
MAEFKITRDKNRCVVCLECLYVCPQSKEGNAYPVIVKSKTKDSPPEMAYAENCIQCLLCFNSCRAKAITLENYHVVEQIIVNEALLRESAKMI